MKKTALITGATSGIGRATAHVFAKHGINLILCGRRQHRLDSVQKALSRQTDVFTLNFDVRDRQKTEEAIASIPDEFKAIDILINNAAINPVHNSIENMSGEVYDKMLNVNLKAAFDLSNLCFPYLKKDKQGAIVNIASVEGLKPSFGLGLYSITKAALIMLTQVQAKEWGKHGIRSNAICPGLIKTKFSSALWQNEKLKKQIEKHLPAGRVAEPIEMSGLAVYLSSSAASYTTGGIYTADGGHMTI